jgi:hypothetical protein
MIDVLGWICTILVLIGYFLNSHGKQKWAFLVWIVGDVGWIYYDYRIDNWSHAALSTAIIFLNLYGLWKNRIY